MPRRQVKQISGLKDFHRIGIGDTDSPREDVAPVGAGTEVVRQSLQGRGKVCTGGKRDDHRAQALPVGPADDRWFVAAEGPITADRYDALSTPLPSDPAWRAELLAVRDVRVLPDGRVGAVLVVRHSRPATTSVTITLFIFARSGDRWLLDDAIGVGPAGPPEFT
jgi:hypothetical protein